MTKRPTFYFNNDEKQPITAGGVLFYKIVNNKMELLVIENRNVYEDFGGCTDEKDKDIYHTVSRETYEESNKIFKKKNIRDRIIKTDKYIYSPKSKYILFILKATDEEEELTTERFGSRELHDDIYRTVKWISIDKFLASNTIRFKMNFRLKNKYIFDMLKNIRDTHKIVVNICAIIQKKKIEERK
jgi:hypothetical protein